MVLSQRGELEERDARRLGLSLSTSICKLETKPLQKPVADQGIKPSSQPSRAARGVPGLHVQTPSQERQFLPQPVARHEHRVFLLLGGGRDSGSAAHFTTDPSHAILLLTANSLQHA